MNELIICSEHEVCTYRFTCKRAIAQVADPKLFKCAINNTAKLVPVNNNDLKQRNALARLLVHNNEDCT